MAKEPVKKYCPGLVLLALPILLTGSAAAQSSGIRTYINPIDIDYKYNFEQLNERISYRSGADPVIVNHRGEYFMFVTVSGGYWHSRDLLSWRFVTPSRWPFEDVVAPAPLSVRDSLYLLQSAFEPRPILFTTTPATGRLEFYNRRLPRLPNMLPPWRDIARVVGDSVPPGPWDPTIFHDPNTDKWYMYWGSSNFYPLYGIGLDKSKRLTYVGVPKALLRLPERHGWDRFGQDHRDTIRPYVEGAWMTKHRGRYYLQYAAPGTEYNVYANGTYVGGSQLGPFTYASSNPVSYKPGGFATGAGHGNTAAPNLAIGDIRIFGTADGIAPATPAGLTVRRDSDPRNAFVTWTAVPGVVGYNVLWGIRPDKLYQTYQVFADRGTTLEIRALTVGQEYYFAIEAFDERSVSHVSAPVPVP